MNNKIELCHPSKLKKHTFFAPLDSRDILFFLSCWKLSRFRKLKDRLVKIIQLLDIMMIRDQRAHCLSLCPTLSHRVHFLSGFYRIHNKSRSTKILKSTWKGIIKRRPEVFNLHSGRVSCRWWLQENFS